VPGHPLDPADPIDQQWWGERLAAVHQHLVDERFCGPSCLALGTPDRPHFDREPWLRQAVSEAVRALDRLQGTDRLTFGALHGNPSAQSFLLDRDTARVGVVGWGSACSGPIPVDRFG
jgi:hypothetical protein